MTDSIARVLVDVSGSLISTVTSGSVNRLAVDAEITDSVLPSGAATEATQATLLTQAEFTNSVGEVTGSPAPNTILGRLKGLYDEFISRLGTLGQKDMSGSTPVVIASDQSNLGFIVYDEQGAAMEVYHSGTLSGTVKGFLFHGKDDTDTAYVPTVALDSGDGKYRMAVDGKVQITIADPPSTAVRKIVYADDPLIVPGNQTRSESYIITNGKRFYIQQIIVGAEGDPTESGSEIAVFYDDGTDHLIFRVYVHGESYPISFPNIDIARDDTTLDGDGTAEIRIDRIRLGGGNQGIDVTLIGYEDTP